MRSLRLVALLAIPAQVAFAQQTAPRAGSLSLEDAIATARKNNPTFLQTENGLRIQDAQVRAAYGQEAIQERLGKVDRHKGRWGHDWIILPNPVYGTGLKGNLDQVFPADKRWADPGEPPATPLPQPPVAAPKQ